MHESETRALRHATMLLLVISALRWGWAWLAPDPGEELGTALPELLDESRRSAEEEARRGTPLGEGETIDPNRADEVDLDRLPGVGPSVARSILAAREGGAVFTRPDDLLAVRGIGPATLDRIRPFIDVSDPPPTSRRRDHRSVSAPLSPARPARIDLNRADLTELQKLPGVGPAIAERILAARGERMFPTVDDLIRVRGIGPATLERLRPHATVGSVR